MKLALVCDDLIQSGGAERMFVHFTEAFPEADVYTSVASKKWLAFFEARQVKVHTSFLQNFPFSEALNRYYAVLLLHIFAFESFDFSAYDVVISTSARFAHHLITKPKTRHICYMHSPGRMFWEPASYFEAETFGAPKVAKHFLQTLVSFPLSLVRMLDYAAAHRVDYFFANSITSQARIKNYYGLTSVVLPPFIDLPPNSDFEQLTSVPKQATYLIICRLVAWKRLDIAIEACNRLNVPLTIIGDGPDLPRLKKIAGTTITFLGYVSDKEKSVQIRNSLALIHPQFEDFGLVPLEVMALGKPVIAFGKGGALETVLEGVTGTFFMAQTVASLVDCLKNFEPAKYSELACKKRALAFNKTNFFNHLGFGVYNTI